MAQRSIGRDSGLVGELVYNLREIQQVVEKTCGKTRRYQKLPEAEAANRVGSSARNLRDTAVLVLEERHTSPLRCLTGASRKDLLRAT